MIAISCIDSSGGIGLNGELPWPSSKEDFAHFKKVTRGKQLLVGRKTLEGLPLLQNRSVYGLTRNVTKNPIEMIEFSDEKNAGKFLINEDNLHLLKIKDLIVAGGAEIYERYIPDCEQLYLTVLYDEWESDCYFPYSLSQVKEMFPFSKKETEIKEGVIFLYSKTPLRI